jgi:hypothetical protein
MYPAIPLTHAYLYRDGDRYDINLSKVSQQYFHSAGLRAR